LSKEKSRSILENQNTNLNFFTFRQFESLAVCKKGRNKYTPRNFEVYFEGHLVCIHESPSFKLKKTKKGRDLTPTFHKEEEVPYTYYLGM
jgi:hypothetical protein